MFTGELAVQFGERIRIATKPTMGLAALFPLRPDSIFNANKVQYDIDQHSEVMSLPVKRGGGSRVNIGNKFQTVEETPPYISESSPINVEDLKARVAGVNKYDATKTPMVLKLVDLALEKYVQLQHMIDRQIEWQASSILQTGTIPYSNYNAKVPEPLADIGFKINIATFFPTTAVGWNAATGKQMRDDIASIGDAVRTKGKKRITDVIMGVAANNNFWGNADNLALLDNRRVEIGVKQPTPLDADGFAFQGRMVINSYELRFWLYDGYYTDPATGVETAYIDTASCIVLANSAERVRMQAAVDIIIPADQEIAQILPGNLDAVISSVAAVSVPWAYTDKDKKTTSFGIDTAPLCVPLNRAGHGCIDTQST